MKNTFNPDSRYAAAQNISRLALGNGHAPLYYENLIYIVSDYTTNEHCFSYNGEAKWFDDDNINTGNSEDNSLIIAELNN